jgi:sterol desaturase/sphingolipid hydroxylase (fatty acid hydroxylase superfamily)
MSRENISDEPMTPRVLALILIAASLVLLGIAILFVFLTDIINGYLPPDLKLPPRVAYFPLSFVIAVIATFAFFYIIYGFLYKSYRS